MNLEHLVVPKSKEVLKNKTKQKNKNGDMSKGYSSHMKVLPIVKDQIIRVTKKVAFGLQSKV